MSPLEKKPKRARARSAAAKAPSHVVGIGGSAGSLEPIERFLGAVATNTTMAFIVVIAGVLDVYALDARQAVIRGLRYAVKIEHAGGRLAAAHYALRRVLSHAECSSVLLFTVELPPRLRDGATRLVLSLADREGAAERVAPAPPRGPDRDQADGYRWMIVDADPDAPRALAGAFGSSVPVVESDPIAAFERTRQVMFDLVVCDARSAFGNDGLLTRLHAADAHTSRRVVLVANEDDRDRIFGCLDDLTCWNSVLCRPLDRETLQEIVRTGAVVQTWSIPILAPRSVGLMELPARSITKPRRVLVVDDDLTTHMLLASTGAELEVTVTADEWEAADLVTSGALDLVVCSFAMRTRGGSAFYRFLWNARADIKRRFVFVARPDMAPTSAGDGRAPAVIERPLTRDALSKLLERYPRVS